MSAVHRERQILEMIRQTLEAEGLDVYLHPSPSMLPPFMAGYRPDMIALGGAKKVAVELIDGSTTAQQKIKHIGERFIGVEDWELRIIHAAPASEPAFPAVQSEAQIASALAEAEHCIEAGTLEAGLVIAWSALEAVGRSLMPLQFTRAQASSRFVEHLAHEGWLTPTDAEFARETAALRNAIAHGDFIRSITAEQVGRLLGIIREMRVPETIDAP